MPAGRVISHRTGSRCEPIFLLSVGGQDAVEAVYNLSDRATLFISTQAGCAVNCVFCSSNGQQGQPQPRHGRDRPGQLWLAVAQPFRRADAVPALGPPSRPSAWISNVVLMGMGEPLQN